MAGLIRTAHRSLDMVCNGVAVADASLKIAGQRLVKWQLREEAKSSRKAVNKYGAKAEAVIIQKAEQLLGWKI